MNTLKVKQVLIFDNGNIAVFDENDNQISELQRYSVTDLFSGYAIDNGFDVSDCVVGYRLPDGSIFYDKCVKKELMT